MTTYNQPNNPISLRGQASNRIAMQPGTAYILPRTNLLVSGNLYSQIQEQDIVTGLWLPFGACGPGPTFVPSNGQNFRLANQTGCAIGALMTNGGSGYLTPPLVTASSGNSSWQAVLGNYVNSITVSNGGNNYLYPPIVLLDVPPTPGVAATAVASISGGAVTDIDVLDQGAGYLTAPKVYIINDPRDTTGNGASAATALAGAGGVTAILCTDFGNPLTEVPDLTVSGGGGSGATADAIMDFALTGYTVTAGGSDYVAAEVTAIGGFPSDGPATDNPTTQENLLQVRKASIIAGIDDGAITASGLVVTDGGHYPGVPTIIVNQTGAGSGAELVATVGGLEDVVTWTAC